MNDNLQSGFRIGDWEVYPQENLLKGPDRVRALEPKVMDVLVFLASRQGDVVSRRRLLDSVWGGVVVGDETLSRAISVLRTELGDDPKNPHYMKTISKRGYRFIADVIPLTRDGSQEVNSVGPQTVASVSAAPASAAPGSPSTLISALKRRNIYRGTTVGLVAAAVIYLVLDNYVLEKAPSNTAQESIQDSIISPDRTMIAVLPFENLGPAEDDYFAAGMSEEISARLGAVSELGVIATNSTRQYAGSDKTSRQIGRELGAVYLVLGSVRWSGEAAGNTRIRVTLRVIDTVEDEQIWAETFDRDFVDVLEIQSGIANAVADLLGMTIREPERQVLEARQTENFEAYIAYLKAQDWIRERVSEETLSHSAAQLQRSVELDPEFVEAWSNLVIIHARFYSFRYDHTDKRRQLALQAVSRVENLAPGSSLAHLSRGVYSYHVERDYDTAWKEFTTWRHLAQGMTPDKYRDWIPALLQRQGRWQESAAERRQMTLFDPRSDYLWHRLGQVYLYLGEFEEAIRCFEIAIELNPDYLGPHMAKAMVSWLRDGATEGARRAFAAAPDVPFSSGSKGMLFWQEIFEGDYRGGLAYLAELPDGFLGMPVYFRPKALYEGVAYSLLGDDKAARASFEAAAEQLESALVSTPNHEALHSALGVTYAALGRTDDAIREGQRAVELVPLESEPWFGLVQVEDLAWIYTLVGEHDRALNELETLLSMPSFITIPYLELDPRWAPLRGHPKYRELKHSFGAPDSVAGK